MSPYHILGISPSATVEEIKRAYKKLANKHHPDKGGDSEKFQQIQQAYETIARNDYGTNQQELYNGFDDFLKSVFKNKKVKPIKKIVISLDESYRGQDLKMGELTIKLPPGIRDTRHEFENFILDIHISPHHLYKRNKNDLMVKIKLRWYEALLGKSCQIKHVSGKEIKFKIQENAYTDQIIRLGGLGMPDPVNANKNGDLFVQIDVENLVKKDLTDPILDAIIQQYNSNINETKIIR